MYWHEGSKGHDTQPAGYLVGDEMCFLQEAPRSACVCFRVCNYVHPNYTSFRGYVVFSMPSCLCRHTFPPCPFLPLIGVWVDTKQNKETKPVRRLWSKQDIMVNLIGNMVVKIEVNRFDWSICQHFFTVKAVKKSLHTGDFLFSSLTWAVQGSNTGYCGSIFSQGLDSEWWGHK